MYQTRGGRAGVDGVTPLVTVDGAAVLVDRGWLAT
jgi:cytochrome oxidase assembly protein ShyY1